MKDLLFNYPIATGVPIMCLAFLIVAAIIFVGQKLLTKVQISDFFHIIISVTVAVPLILGFILLFYIIRLPQNITGTDYSLEIREANTLKLYKTDNQEAEEVKDVEGIKVIIRSEKYNNKHYTLIKCNEYSYDQCVEKIKSNLNTIISSNKESDGFTVVEL